MDPEQHGKAGSGISQFGFETTPSRESCLKLAIRNLTVNHAHFSPMKQSELPR